MMKRLGIIGLALAALLIVSDSVEAGLRQRISNLELGQRNRQRNVLRIGRRNTTTTHVATNTDAKAEVTAPKPAPAAK